MIKHGLLRVACVVLVAGLVLTAHTTGAQDQPAVYYPGRFITLEDPAIVAGSTWRVVFTGPDDFSVTIETANTEAGRLYVAVPPYVDRDGFVVDPVQANLLAEYGKSMRLRQLRRLLPAGHRRPGLEGRGRGLSGLDKRRPDHRPQHGLHGQRPVLGRVRS